MRSPCLLVTVMAAIMAAIVVTSQTQDQGCQRRVCYYTNWSQYRPGTGKFRPGSVDPQLCTHLVYSFAKLENSQLSAYEWNDDTTDPAHPGMYEKFTDLKKKNPQLKTMIAVGGWKMGTKVFTETVATKASRQGFITQAIAFMRQRNFDGLDLDWEYPAARGSPAEDKHRFTLLVQELRAAFDDEALASGRDRLLLSAAVAAGRDKIEAAYEIPEMAAAVDWLNVMTYDFHGVWDHKTGHHSPLFQHPSDTVDPLLADYNTDAAIQYYIKNGTPAGKINLGLPMYGKNLVLADANNSDVNAPVSGSGPAGPVLRQKGVLSYYEICDKIQAGAVVHRIPSQHVPYAVAGTEWIGYDDEQSIREKVDYALDNGLGGVMFWSLDLDDFTGQHCGQGRYPLMNAAKDECQAYRRVATVTGNDTQTPSGGDNSTTVASSADPKTSVLPSSDPMSTGMPSSDPKTSADPISTVMSSADPMTTGMSSSDPMSTGMSTSNPLSTSMSSSDPMSTGISTSNPMSTGMSSSGPMSTGMSSSDPMSTGMSSSGPMSTGMSPSGPMSTGMSSSGPMTTGMSPSDSMSTVMTSLDPQTTIMSSSDPTPTKLPSSDPQTTKLMTTLSQTTNAKTTSGTVVTCDPNGKQFIPNPDNCYSYYICAGDHPIPVQCAQGLTFNADTMFCDLPANHNCKEVKPTTAPPTTQQPPTSKPSGQTGVTCDPSHDDFLPNPDNCSFYYMCIAGTPIPVQCAKGLTFNAATKFCDLPENHACKLPQQTTMLPTTTMPTTFMSSTPGPATSMPTPDMSTSSLPSTDNITATMSTTDMNSSANLTSDMPNTSMQTSNVPSAILSTNTIPTTPMSTTLMPTTLMPTTPMPTTPMPTTPMPTTPMPTTPMPTTPMPTTPKPTTLMPTTPMPTTPIPTTPIPTTPIPTTPMPTTPPPPPKTTRHHQHINIMRICEDRKLSDGIHRDPTDCRHYIQCANHHTVRFNCAPGTAFDPHFLICDYVAHLHC